jgi:eukaryotic translation initiation factor 2C
MVSLPRPEVDTRQELT